MAFCAGCGTDLGRGAFCSKCGRPAAGRAPAPAPDLTGGTGLQENVAGLLCYSIGWLTGIVFLLIDKRPYVRFHALQSVIVFGTLNMVQGSAFFGIGSAIDWRLGLLISGVFVLLIFACWMLCMVKAYQGERFKLPFAGDMAENASK